MLSVSEAKSRILAAVRPVAAEMVTIDGALGRYLAEEVSAPWNLPPSDSSAMDGFAVRAFDVPGELPVAGVAAAGDAPGTVLEPGTVLRIMTGAPMPAGADCVVIREDVDDRGQTAVFSDPAQAGQNIRRTGEDVAAGARVLTPGLRMSAGEIGIAAALGRATMQVSRRPRVAVLASGDELVAAGMLPRAGQIVSSNSHAVAAQVREAGGVPIIAGIAPDEPAALKAMIERCLAADVLVTSGGVSIGDYDFVKAAFADAGVTMDFWKVAMKPGKPLAFGVAPGGALVFGLPGNPVSSMVVFELMVRPALLAMQGARVVERPRVSVVVDGSYRKSPGRAHYVRATLSQGSDILEAKLLAKQGSGMLSSMLDIDALIEIERDHGDVAAGERLSALLVRAA